MKGQKQRKFTEKRPPDKKNKPKYIAKEDFEAYNQKNKSDSQQTKPEDQKKHYQKNRQGYKPKKQFDERELMMKRESSY